MKVKQAIEKLNKECSQYLPNTSSDIIKIMEFVLELNETGVLTKSEDELSPTQQERFDDAFERVKSDEPIEHITGTAYFYGNRYAVTKDTLIPRPETEVLVDLAIGEISYKIYDPDKEDEKELRVLDIGTGTGCIIISLALSSKYPMRFYASEKSDKALEVANRNIKDAKLDKAITTYRSDLFENIPDDKKFDIVIANLPYISPSEYQKLPKSVKDYEPEEALVSSKEGKETILRLLEDVEERIEEGGVIVLEMDPSQVEEIEKKAQKVFPEAQTIKSKDLNGKERFLTIRT